jgi:hypothetical protein
VKLFVNIVAVAVDDNDNIIAIVDVMLLLAINDSIIWQRHKTRRRRWLGKSCRGEVRR